MPKEHQEDIYKSCKGATTDILIAIIYCSIALFSYLRVQIIQCDQDDEARKTIIDHLLFKSGLGIKIPARP